MAQLKDYVIVQPKSKIKAGEGLNDGEYKFFTSSNTQSKWLNRYQYDKPALIFGTGGMASVHFCDTPFSTSTDCIVMYAKDNLNLEYVYRYLESHMYILENGFKGVGLKHISKEYILSISIPKVDSCQQESLVLSTRKIDEIICVRQNQLTKLDELVKSRFIEMFGVGNYPTVKAKDVCEFITKGTTPPTREITEEYEIGKVPYLKVYNLSFSGKLLFDNAQQFIPIGIHNKQLARSKVYPNDVLMNIVGPPLGKFSLVTDEFNEWNINQAIAIFRTKESVLPRYLMAALMQPNVLRPFLEQAVGIRQLNLSLEQCRNLEFSLPPLEKQKAFVEFAEQTDKSKLSIQQSLEKLETLKKSLMQQYFG